MSVQLVIAAWLIDLATVWIAKRWLGGEIQGYILMCGAYALRVGGASVIVPDA